MLKNKVLWEFPTPSTAISDGGVVFLSRPGMAMLLFDYYDIDIDEVYNSGIYFDFCFAHKRTAEKFFDTFIYVYDYLIEVENSPWVKQFSDINKSPLNTYDSLIRGNFKHYAIWLDTFGLYEFIASNYLILETKKGTLPSIINIKQIFEEADKLFDEMRKKTIRK